MDTMQTRGRREQVQQLVLTNKHFQVAELLWRPLMDEDTNTMQQEQRACFCTSV